MNKFNYKKATDTDSFSDDGSNTEGTDTNPVIAVTAKQPLAKLSSHVSVGNTKDFGVEDEDVEMQLDGLDQADNHDMDSAFGIGADSDDQEVLKPSRKKKKSKGKATSQPAAKSGSHDATAANPLDEMMAV